MRLKARFSLKMLLLLVAIAAVTTFVSLNGRRWYQDYLDWNASRAVRARAERVFRDETRKKPPSELVHILGSGDLSHWARVYDIGLTAEQIISCGRDQAVRCWSTETGQSLQVIADVEGHIAAKSSLLVTIDNEQQARVYDTSFLPVKLQLAQFSIANGSAVRKAFTSPLDGILAVIRDDEPNDVQLLNLNDGMQMSRLRLAHEAEQACFGFREDGRLLAACKDELLLIDAETGKVVTQWRHDPWPFNRQAIRHAVRLQSPWWLIVGASTNIVWNEENHDWKEVDISVGGTPGLVVPGRTGQAWVASSGIVLEVAMGQDTLSQSIVQTTPVMPVSCMSFRRYTGGGQLFTLRAIGYGPGQVGLLDSYGRLRLPRDEVDHITAITWNHAGDLFGVGTSAGEIVVMRTGSWAELQRFRAHGGAVEYLEFSPDNVAILSEEDHEIAVFDWRSSKSLVRKSRQASPSRDATLTSGGGRLLAWVLNEGWTLTDYISNTLVAQSERKAPRPQPFSPQGVVWSDRDECFVFVSREGFCRIEVVGESSDLGPVLDISEESNSDLRYLRDISVRDSHALLVDYSKQGSCLNVWNWQSSVRSVIELDRIGGMPSAAFSPSGRDVGVVLSGDLIIYSQAGEELYRHSLGPIQMVVSAIEFSPDGRYIAIVNGNGTCYLLRNPLD